MDDAVAQHKEEANRNELLIWASARGLLGDAKELVRTGADPATKDKKGFTPLHYAASHGHQELGEFLATHGVDLDAEDPRGRTPLHYAAAAGKLSMVQFLASKLVWLDSYDSEDDTALHIAARRGDTAMCQHLGDKGAKVNLVNKRGLTPLGEALVGGHVEAAEALLAKGAHKDTMARGFTLLHLVCGLGLRDAAASLLGPKAKADPNEASNSEALTPLHAAAMAGSLECVELLLANGANAAARSAAGALPAELFPDDDEAVEPPAPGGRGAKPGVKPAAKARAMLEAAAAKAAKGAKAGGKGGAAAAPAAAAAKAPAPQKPAVAAAAVEDTFEGAFAKLPRDEQLRKVNLYMRMPESEWPQQLPPDAKAQIREIQRSSKLLECAKAVNALREDEEFQQDVVNPKVKAAMEEIKQTNDASKYQDDSRVMGVMRKMNRLQGVVRLNGNPPVTLEMLIAEPTGEQSVANMRKRVANMEEALLHMREQAVLLLMGKSKEAAAAAASVARPAVPPGEKEEGKKTEAKKAKAAVKGKSEIEAAPADAATSAAPAKALAGLGLWPSSSAEGDRPKPTTFGGHMRQFGSELLQQVLRSGALMLLTFAVMWLLGMVPGQRAPAVVDKLVPEELQQAAKAVLQGTVEGMAEE